MQQAIYCSPPYSGGNSSSSCVIAGAASGAGAAGARTGRRLRAGAFFRAVFFAARLGRAAFRELLRAGFFFLAMAAL
jgi:hypothetical protein